MEVFSVMGQVGDALGPIELALNLCKTICSMALNAKANKERCQRVAKRVKGLQELVLTIKERRPEQISGNVANALKELSDTLAAAKQLMVKFSQTKSVKGFLKSSTHEDQFNNINERLSDNFQVLSGALQVEQGDVLHRVYESVRGRKQEEESSEQASCISSTTPSMYSPTAAMPPPGPLPPMPVSMPFPMPPPGPLPPMPLSMPFPMPPPGPLPPMPLSMPVSPTFVSQPVFHPQPVISSIMTYRPVLRPIAPMQVTSVRNYVVTNSYFP